MNRWFLIFLFFVLSGCNSNTLINLKGERVKIETDVNTKGIVYMFLVPDCPFSQFYTMAVNQVFSIYNTRGFKFYGIVPGNLYTLNEIDSFKSQYDFGPQILVDKKYGLSEKYHVSVVPQVVVTDKEGRVLYSGKIDDQAIQAGQKKYQPTRFYLLDALKNIYSGKPVAIKKTKAAGCYIE